MTKEIISHKPEERIRSGDFRLAAERPAGGFSVFLLVARSNHAPARVLKTCVAVK
jgi:hypothetical protein